MKKTLAQKRQKKKAMKDSVQLKKLKTSKIENAYEESKDKLPVQGNEDLSQMTLVESMPLAE